MEGQTDDMRQKLDSGDEMENDSDIFKRAKLDMEAEGCILSGDEEYTMRYTMTVEETQDKSSNGHSVP